MTNRKENRQETLKKMGVDTNNFISITFNEGLKPGTKLNVYIEQPEEVHDTDNAMSQIHNQIIKDGYVKNTKLHRRWIMAQMFRMLNYKSNRTGKVGYDAYLEDNYDYHYQFAMMLEEIRVLAILEKRDEESFKERVHFFDPDVILNTFEDYLVKLQAYVNKCPEKNCKCRKYKRLFNQNIYVENIENVIFYPICNYIHDLRDIIVNTHKLTYSDIYNHSKCIVNYIKTHKLPSSTPKCKEWKDAFKGAGSYYTLMNMVKFHECYLYDYNAMQNPYYTYDAMFGSEACEYLTECLDGYKGNYYKMFALLKQAIKYNTFDFYTRMDQVYS